MTADDEYEDELMPLYQLVLSFPTNVGDTPPKIRLQYDASDPEAMAANPTWPDTPFVLPEEGLIRIWRRADTVLDRSAAEAGWTSGPQGDFVVPGVGYTEEDLEGEAFDEDGVVTLYIQGVRAGVGTVQFWLDVDGDGPGGFALADEVKYTALDIDIIGNSLNIEGFDPSEALAGAYGQMTAALAEQMGNNPAANPLGMIVIVNDNDDDGDGIVDWADGFNLDGRTGTLDDRAANFTETPWVKKEEHFAKIEVKFDGYDFGANSKARIRIEYSASQPTKVTPLGSPPTYALPAEGVLRLWTKSGVEPRTTASFVSRPDGDSTNGYYVTPNGSVFQGMYPSYGPAQWRKLGLGPGNNSLTVVVEAVRTAAAPYYTTRITVMGDPLGNNKWRVVATYTLRPVRIGLDVNANGSLDDAVDGSMNYTPGYVGDTPVLSTGTTFAAPTYVGQQMRVIVEGLGTNSGLSSVSFQLVGVTSEDGFAGNATDPAVTGAGKQQDFSFKQLEDWAATTPEMVTVGESQTWTYVYAKDYGGWALVRVFGTFAERTHLIHEFSIPGDSDRDGIADRWERKMGALWNLQFGDSYPINPAFFVPGQDNERVDPDGANTDGFHDMPEHARPGDGKTVAEEYRGYVLSGGGNGVAGGHIRLEPHTKELLVEMDVMADSVLLEDADLPELMGDVAVAFNHPRRGSGIEMYWIEDEVGDRRAPHEIFASENAVFKYLASRKEPLLGGFVPLLFADGLTDARGPGITKAGSVVFWFELEKGSIPTPYIVKHGAYTTIAHELTHNLQEHPFPPGFDTDGHVTDGNRNGVPDEQYDMTLIMHPRLNAFNAGRILFNDMIRKNLSLFTDWMRQATRRP